MGILELAAIFLVAFLVLGPNKSIDMARTTGKVLGNLRRTFDEVIAATTLDVEDPNATGNVPTGSGSMPKDSSDDFPSDSPRDSLEADRQ